MKLKYTKITETRYKFFYEGPQGQYGEFFIEITPDNSTAPIAGGTAEIFLKDIDYASTLIAAFAKAMIVSEDDPEELKESV